MTRPTRTDIAGVSRIKPLSARRVTTISVLDVGSTKVCCLVARLRPREGAAQKGRTHTVEVLGFGSTRSRGVKSGVVANLGEAEQAIRVAVDQAERMADVTVGSLIVNVSCGRLRSEAYSASVALAGDAVAPHDVQRVLAAGGAHSVTPGRVVVHALPIGYAIDGQRGIAEPQGMVGRDLGVDMHVVTADEAPLKNLELAVNRCHLEVETVVATPYAAGLAALADDEARLGAAVIDMGGGTTTLAVFLEGQFVHADAIPVGGHHVTLDIARGLSTRLDDAERLKARHGSALASLSDETDILTVPSVGEDEHDHPNTVPRAALTRIVRPRIEETLEMARDMLVRSGLGDRVGQRVVLTGGASQLTGLAETARRMLGKNVRLGRPLGIAGLPEEARSPAYAAAVGLIVYPQVARIEQFRVGGRTRLSMTGTDGYIARVGRWLKESF
jgi:cell division protein FtsA